MLFYIGIWSGVFMFKIWGGCKEQTATKIVVFSYDWLFTLFLVLTISSISLSFIYNLPQSRARGQNLWMSRPIFCRILWRCANCFLNFKCDLPEIFCFQELDWSAAKLESEVSFLWTLLQTLSNVLLSITMLTCSSISIYICVARTILKLSPGSGCPLPEVGRRRRRTVMKILTGTLRQTWWEESSSSSWFPRYQQ